MHKNVFLYLQEKVGIKIWYEREIPNIPVQKIASLQEAPITEYKKRPETP